jgi:hypothetical protein
MISDEITQYIVTQRDKGMSFANIRSRIVAKWCEEYATAMIERLYNQEKNNPKYSTPDTKPILSETELEEFLKWKKEQQKK